VSAVPSWAATSSRIVCAAEAGHRQRIRNEAAREFYQRPQPLNADKLAELREILRSDLRQVAVSNRSRRHG
jgi:hypothetical protein